MNKRLLRLKSIGLAFVMLLSVINICFSGVQLITDATENENYIKPTTASGLIVPINTALNWWGKGFELYDMETSNGGLTFGWLNKNHELGIRNGIMETLSLDGLTLNFNNLETFDSSNGVFAVIISDSIRANDMDPTLPQCATSSIVLVVDTLKGKISFANADHNGTSFNTATNGTALIENDILKYKNISGKPFSISFSKGDEPNYNIEVNVNGKIVKGENKLTDAMLTKAGIDDRDHLYVALSSWAKSYGLYVDLESIGPVKKNTATMSAVTVATASISQNELQSWWKGAVTTSEASKGGMKIKFSNAYRNMRQGVTTAIKQLDGMYLGFDSLSPISSADEYPKFAIILSQSKPQAEAQTGDLILGFDTVEGKIYQITNADFTTGNELLIEDLRLDQIIGKPFSIYVKKNDEGKYILHVATERFDIETAIRTDLIPGFNPDKNSYVAVTPMSPEGVGQNFVIDWYDVGTKRATVKSVTEAINALGDIESISLDSAVAIRKARELYDELAEDLKSQISNYNSLVAAEEKYVALVTEANSSLTLLSRENSMLLGSGNPSASYTINTEWASFLKIEDVATGGIRYNFTSSMRDVREGYLRSVAIDGLYLQFDNLVADLPESTSFTLYLGNTKPPYGPESSHYPLTLTLDPEQGKIVANYYAYEGDATEPTLKSEAVVTGEILKLENIANTRFSYLFNINNDGDVELSVTVKDDTVKGIISRDARSASSGLTDYSKCYVMVTNWNNFTPTYSVEFVGLKQTKKTATDVISLIDDIGIVTYQSGDKIDAAMAEYDKLSPSVQGDVINYNVLLAAKEAFDILDYNDMIRTAEKLIDSIGTPSYTSGVAIEKAGTYLTRLNDEQLSKVENLADYNTAVQKYYGIIQGMLEIETAVNGFGVGANSIRVANGAIPSWEKNLISTGQSDGSLHLEWKGAIRDMRNGPAAYFNLDGLYLRWANLTKEAGIDGAKLSVQIGPENEYRESGDCMAFVFDTEKGTLTCYPLNRLMIESDLLKHSNIEGKEVSMKFTYTDEQLYLLTIKIGDDILRCTVPSALLLDPTLQIKQSVRVALSPWVNNDEAATDGSIHSFSVDLISVRSGDKFAFEDFYSLIDTIEKLPDKITAADEMQVDQALELYKELPKIIKNKVTNYNKLGNAINSIYELTQDDYTVWANAEPE